MPPGDGRRTADLIDEIGSSGVDHIVVMIRHAAREYRMDIPEEDNPLTDEGRAAARAFGEMLSADWTLRACTSPVDRCVETATLALEGHGSATDRPLQVIPALGSFYILDRAAMGHAIRDAGGLAEFFEGWFRGEERPGAVIPCVDAARYIGHVLANRARRDVPTPRLDLLASHDMNQFAVRSHLAGVPVEDQPIEYLDALAVYERAGEVYIHTLHGPPRRLAP